MGVFKWLYPGLRLKRWIALCAVGMILCSMGFVLSIIESQEISGSISVVLGVCAVVVSVRKIIKSFANVLNPNRRGDLFNVMLYRGILSHGPRIVAIGGGTGLSAILQGLKERTSNITAIVTVSDDGGSSGRLRSQFNVLPPGDIRSCLVALADDETMMRELFQFRFKENEANGSSDLHGHNFGNLFILAMAKITGDFEKAIRESSNILNIRGRVVPSTLTTVTLAAEHADGKRTSGETNISNYPSKIEKISLVPSNSRTTFDALSAVGRADAIVFGPGSLFTSVLPNLLIEDLQDAIIRTHVPRIYVCNIMTQPNETSHLETDFQHVDALIRHTRPDLISHCIVNNGKISQKFMDMYKEKSAYLLKSEAAKIRGLGYEVIEANLVQSTDFVRHNSRKLAKIITEIAQTKRGTNGLSRKKTGAVKEEVFVKTHDEKEN